MPAQSWPVTIRVRYERSAQKIPDGASFPLVNSLFEQAPSEIFLDEFGVSEDAIELTLVFGEEPVLRTGNLAFLWLPVRSPP
jgi:hypothetical protein